MYQNPIFYTSTQTSLPLPGVCLIKTHLVCSNLLLQLGSRAPDDTTGNQSFCLFCPAQNELLHTPIFLHLSLRLITRERPRQKN